MPTMIPVHSIRIRRDDKNIVPPVGQPFDFTDSEVKEIRSHSLTSLRRPVNESQVVVAKNETDLTIRGDAQPDADATRDANLLRRAPAKAGGKARNQGGSIEESDKAAGIIRDEDKPAPPEDDDEL